MDPNGKTKHGAAGVHFATLAALDRQMAEEEAEAHQLVARLQAKIAALHALIQLSRETEAAVKALLPLERPHGNA